MKTKTLYDVIGARQDDDAENLKKAYRQAAKANHPDHHASDPDAALRFRRIAAAYDVLRDEEQRAAYDRLLEFRRKPLRTKLRQAVSEVRRHAVYDTIVAAAITATLIGGYTLVSRISGGTSAPETTAVTEGEPVRTAAVVPPEPTPGAEWDRAAPQMPIVVPVMPGADTSVASDRLPVEAKGESTRDAAGPVATVAGREDDSDGLINRPAATGVTGDPGSLPRPAPLERNKTPSVETPFSGAEMHGSASRVLWSRSAFGSHRAPWSQVAASGDRRDARTSDVRTSEPAGVNAGDGGQQAPARRQAAMENRNASTGDMPPLFGVGF